MERGEKAGKEEKPRSNINIILEQAALTQNGLIAIEREATGSEKRSYWLEKALALVMASRRCFAVPCVHRVWMANLFTGAAVLLGMCPEWPGLAIAVRVEGCVLLCLRGQALSPACEHGFHRDGTAKHDAEDEYDVCRLQSLCLHLGSRNLIGHNRANIAGRLSISNAYTFWTHSNGCNALLTL